MATNSGGSSSGPAWVRLNSLDGYSFVIPKEMALGSGFFRASLDEQSNFAEQREQKIDVQQRGIILTRVIEYLAYKQQYADTPAKDVHEDFSERIEPEVALELLMAADFLDV